MKYIFLLLVSCLSLQAFAGTISGRLDLLKDGDSVIVFGNIYGGEPRFIGYLPRYSGVVKNKMFRISIPVGDFPLNVLVRLGSDGQYADPRNMLLENTDDIRISGDRQALTFTGRGSANWRTMSHIDSIYEKWEKGILWPFGKYAREYFEHVDSSVLSQLSYLESQKSKLSSLVYRLVRANMVGFYYGKTGFIKNLEGVELKIALDSIRTYSDGIGKLLPDLNTLLQDPVSRYANFLTNGIEAVYRLDSCAIPGKKFSAAGFYEYIKQHYNGPGAERLMVNTLYRARDTEEGVSDCLTDAQTRISDKVLRSIVTALAENRVSGSVAFAFSLPDSSGLEHHMSDFRGKVVLMDFWFTGCGNCVRVHPYLDSIRQLFKGSDLEFITVNVDKNKDWWLSSLNSKKYTSSGSLNLNTGSAGMDHPILRYYWIDAYPTLLLINRKGRLMPNPVDPRYDDGVNLVRLINQGLNE